MPFDLVIDNDWYKLTITSSAFIYPNDSDVAGVTSHLQAMHSVVPINKLTFKVKEPGPHYEYHLKLMDDRQWKQTVTTPIEGDPYMTFDVSDQWRKSEFEKQRTIRDLLVTLWTRGMTSFDFKFKY